MSSTSYTETFYIDRREDTQRSAEEIVPLVVELIQPRSVIDVGCALGTWLSVFTTLGVEDIWGVDGAWIDRDMLRIPEDRFVPFDLEKPLHMDRRFDLVLSLEVVEHLPVECGETYVDTLVGLGLVVLFSASIPFQDGTNHLNERWPDYWVEQFRNRGYVPIDCVRRRIWLNDSVAWWHAQNILLFVEREYLTTHALLRTEFEKTKGLPLSLVHPRNYLRLHERCRRLERANVWASDLNNRSLREVLSAIPPLAKQAIRRRLERLLGQPRMPERSI